MPSRQVKKKAAKRRGQRGWGGRWRAYVRAKTLGCKGTPKLADLAVAYTAATAAGGEEIDRLGEVGQAATRAGRAFPPKAGASAFGAKSRDAKRLQLKEFREAVCAATRSMDKEESALAVAGRVALIGADIATCLSVARATLAQQGKNEKARLDEQRTALRAYQLGEGSENLQKMQVAMPGVQIAGLVPVPSSQGMVFEYLPDNSATVAQAASWAHGTKETNTSASMKRYWGQLHQPLRETDCDPLVDVKAALSKCRAAGRCSCTGEGMNLHRIRNSFLKEMKKVFKKDTAQRQHLLAGEVVVMLTGCPREDDYEAFLALDDPIKTVLLHVGMMYLKPYQPTFLLMENDDAYAGNGPSQRIRIKVCSSFFVQMRHASLSRRAPSSSTDALSGVRMPHGG